MENQLAGVDYSQYGSWEKIVAPSGAMYYAVPGTGFVYDPFLSSQKGRPVLWQNPKATWEEKKAAEKATKDASSPLGQLLPVAGVTAGTIGAKYAVDALGPTTAAEKLAEAQLAKQAAAQTAEGAFQTGAASGSLPAPEILGATRVPGEAVNTATTTMPYQDGITPSNTLSALAIAKGSYDAQKGYEHGGEGVRSGATQIGAGIGSLIGGPLGAGAGAAIGNTIGYGLQGSGWKNDLALLAAGGGITAPLIIARHMGVDLMHKTTKQVQQEHTQQLAEKAPEDQQWINYLGGMRDQQTNKDAPFAGKYKTFDEYKKAGLQANDLTGVYGNLKTFGPEWAKLNFDQQQAVTQGLIDADLYSSKKGEVVVKDEDKAHDIKNRVLGVIAKPATTPQEAFGAGAGIQVSPQSLIGNITPKPLVMDSAPRSVTSSPGIGLDGQRLDPKQIGKLLAGRLNKK